MKITHLALASALILNISACKKESKEPQSTTEPPANTQDQSSLNKQVLTDVSTNVINTSYNDLSNKATALYNALATFNTSTDASNLAAAQQAWRDVRSVYEQTEGFLFGPMNLNDIDPRVDTWPIDFARLDSLLASSTAPTPFTASYIDGLEESLKGFHPIEYLLFGTDGNKTPAQFTARQKDLLMALSDNLKTLCTQVKDSWDPATPDNYTVKFTTAGSGSATYPTLRAAYEEVINAMTDICDEVANGKMKDPFDQKDASLEESPFSKNSLTDFSNNIKSVQNMYLGKYNNTDGKGLEDLIKAGNISMDNTIKTKIAAALTSLGNVTVPFGQAISDTNGQRPQIQNAMTAVNDLKDYLEGDVKKYLQTITN